MDSHEDVDIRHVDCCITLACPPNFGVAHPCDATRFTSREMMRHRFIGGIALGVLVSARAASGQAAPIPVRQLPSADAESPPDVVASIASFRATSSGGVFISDVLRRRVVLFDSSLRSMRVVTDVDGTQARYGSGSAGMFAYGGDSTLLLSGSSLSIVVLDANGTVGRVMAPPRPSDFGQMMGGTSGIPALDARGRLVYRSAGPTMQELVRLGKLGTAPPPDSAALVRFDFKTRRLDTVTYVRIYSQRIIPHVVEQGKMFVTWMSQILNPAPVVDDWAVLSDGTIAVARGQDYHVDFFDSDNVRSAGTKIPFAWRHLSPDDKAALLDSTRALRARLVAQGIGVNRGVAPAPGMEPVAARTATVSTSGGGDGSSTAQTSEPPAEYVAPDELPDYQPAFAVGSLRADQDGRLWVRTIPPQPLGGGAIYDVLDGHGTLIDRIQVPRNSAIAGFGPGGTVYLVQRDGAALRIKRCRYQNTRS
jgi:hypothetical protein